MTRNSVQLPIPEHLLDGHCVSGEDGTWSEFVTEADGTETHISTEDRNV